MLPTLFSDACMTAYTPDMDAALAAEIEKRRIAANQPPEQSDKGNSDASARGDKQRAETAGAVSSANDGDEDKGSEPPATPEALDLSFEPESVRSKVHVDDEAALAALKSGYMAHSEATKRFTTAKALERDAENYRNLTADPDIASAVAKVIADKKAGKSPASPQADAVAEVDWSDPASITQFIDARAEAKARAERTALEAEMNRPSMLKEQVNAALTVFASDNDIEQAVMVEAVKLADADLVKRKKTWNPDTVEVLMAPWVEVAKARKASLPIPAANKTPTANATIGTAEVASPVGRGGPHQEQPVPFPKHWKNGKPPNRPLTNDEWDREDLFRWQQRLGPNVTAEDIRAAMRGR